MLWRDGRGSAGPGSAAPSSFKSSGMWIWKMTSLMVFCVAAAGRSQIKVEIMGQRGRSARPGR